jgi:hypothetical protein
VNGKERVAAPNEKGFKQREIVLEKNTTEEARRFCLHNKHKRIKIPNFGF